jgi:hypothetical protein
MSYRSKGITSLLLLVVSLLFFSGCSKSRAVPTENEAKNAIESHITQFANLSQQLMLSPVKVVGIDSFKLLESYDHNYDYSKLAGRVPGEVDLKYLNQTKSMYKGDCAIVKVSYILRFNTQQDTPPQENKWFYMQKPEQGKWEVGIPLSAAKRD